jgi:hypothetical protein
MRIRPLAAHSIHIAKRQEQAATIAIGNLDRDK